MKKFEAAFCEILFIKTMSKICFYFIQNL